MNKTDYLVVGDLYGFVSSAYTDVAGAWAYLFLFGIFIVMIYLKSQSFTLPIIVTFVGCAAFAFVLPPMVGAYIAMVLALASAVIFIRVFKS
jgi:hypothetical protein